MATSIFDTVPAWAASTAYTKHFIVTQGGYFYYAKVDFTSGVSFDASNWYGIGAFNGSTYPKFEWRCSYTPTIAQEPRLKSIKFGDGYEQLSSDSINNDLITFEAVFNERRIEETTAILHFLTQRGGSDSFIFSLPPPYTKDKVWVCKSWSSVPVFLDNISIRAKFEERTV